MNPNQKQTPVVKPKKEMRAREFTALLFALALDVLGVVLYVSRTPGTSVTLNPRPIIETAQAAAYDRTLITPSQ